jgi:hypothetical protein
MRKTLALALCLDAILFHPAQADTMKDFVRVSCVPEAGLLDVEYRDLHDSVAGYPGDGEARNAGLVRAGFLDPHGLKTACTLGGVTYAISTEQGPQTQSMCGDSPEVYLTVTRNGHAVFSKVVFGNSCNGLPSVMRFTAGEVPRSWRGREAQFCYSTGKDTDPVACEWTFGEPAQFGKRFPIDQERLQRVVNHEERR